MWYSDGMDKLLTVSVFNGNQVTNEARKTVMGFFGRAWSVVTIHLKNLFASFGG